MILEVLAQADPHSARIVELRYFGGLSEAELAETLDISERTLRRAWQKARLMLVAALQKQRVARAARGTPRARTHAERLCPATT